MNSSPEPSRVTEDYLALIWKASEWPDDGREPSTTDIASSLGVAPSTVSAQLKRLAQEELINYKPYGAITLTAEGEQIARAVVRRHRILETYLVEKLHVPWDEVHKEADQLEHASSDTLIARMDKVLGYPNSDPHGDPIPRENMATPDLGQPLASYPSGARVHISRVSDENPEILRFLAERNLMPGVSVTVEDAMTSTGLMAISINGERIEMSAPIANAMRALSTE